MPKPTIIIHNIETNEVIEREMNKQEFDQYKVFVDDCNKRQAEADAKEAERQAILDRLGLTADELKTILG